MIKLHFTSGDKEKLYGKLTQSMQNVNEREDVFMKKWTLPKAAAVAAACLMVTGATAFAASKITTYVGSSNGSYDYTNITEMSAAQSDAQGKYESTMPEFPETIGHDYRFDGGNTVHTSGLDDSGNTVGTWDDLRAVYKNDAGNEINLFMSYKPFDDGGVTPTDTRTIKGITVSYNYDEYLFLPDEKEPLAPEVQSRLENDAHFYVSYGSAEAETIFYSGVHFEKDGITFNIYSRDDVTADELFSIAEELIDR